MHADRISPNIWAEIDALRLMRTTDVIRRAQLEARQETRSARDSAALILASFAAGFVAACFLLSFSL